MPPANERVIGPDEAAFETVMLEMTLVEGMQAEKLTAGGRAKRTRSGITLTEKGMDLQNAALLEFME